MNKLSFRQYRAIDLGIFAVILCVFETIAAKAAVEWFPQEFYMLSPTITVVCIVMMRWGGWAAIHAAAGGAAYCAASGASVQQFIIYCAGNCLALAALLLFRTHGRDRVRSSAPLTAAFTAAAYAGAQLGRGLAGLFFGGTPASVVMFFTTDSLSLLFAVVVVLIARRADGLFEEQRSYLIRTQEERMREQNKDYYR